MSEIGRSFIEKIEELSKTNIIEVNGRQYADSHLSLIKAPTPSSMDVHTLQAIADYVNSENEEASLVVHVESPDSVHLYSILSEDLRQREHFLSASLISDSFHFGRKLETEEFIIGLQANFIQDDNTAMLMSFAGNMVTTSNIGTLDDGVSQSAEVKSGLADTTKVKIPNPVTLRPRRTFPEIEQPVSDFVFRADTSHRLALHSVDGGAWKIEAISSIKEWLKAAIEYENVAIIA